jgi:hypothetical protein
MQAVLIDHRSNRGQFSDLVSDRLGVIAGQGVATSAALRRPDLYDLPELFWRDQRASPPGMAGLPSGPSARRRDRWASFDRGRVG